MSKNNPIVMQSSTEFCDANILSVKVETTGPCGGDAGHGGFTRLTFNNEGGTDMSVVANEEKITLEFRGDSEQRTLLDALRFAVQFLENPK